MLFHWVVQLWMIPDSYALILRYLTTDRRGGGGGGQAHTDGTAVCCAWLDDFDWVVPDRIPDIFESGRVTEEYLSDLTRVEEVFPHVSPVMPARAGSVPVSSPTVAEIVSAAVFVEEAAPVVAPLTEEETFIVGMVSLIEAGSDLPVESILSVFRRTVALLMSVWLFRSCLQSYLRGRLLCRCPCLPLLKCFPNVFAGLKKKLFRHYLFIEDFTRLFSTR